MQEEHALNDLVFNALEEVKAENVLVMDAARLSNITSAVIVASGTSRSHVQSLAENVIRQCKEHGYSCGGCEGSGETGWVLVDLGDVVVHVMTPAMRQFYDLEGLWQSSAFSATVDA